MTSILKAVYDWFKAVTTAGSVYALVGGRLYFGRAPDSAAFPYIVYDAIDQTPDYAFGPTTFDGTRLQFTIFHDNVNDLSSSATVLEALRTRFDHAALTFSGSDYASVAMVRDQSVGPEEADGRVQVTQDYLLTTQKL